MNLHLSQSDGFLRVAAASPKIRVADVEDNAEVALNRPCEVEVHSDSQYVVNAFNKHWIDGWKKRGWKTANKQLVKNRDLWERLLAAKSKHKVEFIWVKGHAGHELNERCDELATTAADGANLDIDTGFNESDL